MRIIMLLAAVAFAVVCAFAQDHKRNYVHPNKSFRFDSTDVHGYLDNPTLTCILDSDDPSAEPIHLERSFKDALCENLDKETVDRQSR